jgi:hypothetical protein
MRAWVVVPRGRGHLNIRRFVASAPPPERTPRKMRRWAGRQLRLYRRGTKHPTARGARRHREIAVPAVFVLSGDDPIREAPLLDACATLRAVGRPGQARAGWRRGLVVALEVLHREVDGESQSGDIDADAAQYLAGPALDVENANQQVLRLDLGVASLEGQPSGSVDRPLGPGRQLPFTVRRGDPRTDGFGDLGSGCVAGRAGGHQGPLGWALDRDKSEQEVLGTKVGVIQVPRLVLGHPDNPTGALAESFHPQTSW